MGCCFTKKKSHPKQTYEYIKRSQDAENNREIEPMEQIEQSDIQDVEVIILESKEDIQVTKKKERQKSWIQGEVLGQGAFGRVVIGMQSTGQVIAVKQVYIHNSNEEKIEYLTKEIAMLSKLQHPNIVRYLGCEQKDSFMNIFLEYVSGGSVSTMLSRFGCFKESLIKTYLKQILLGLSYLHGKNVIHRDIKGGNILIDNSGKCKLADFGSSKQLTDITHDSMGSICGTPNFMAPEVINQELYGKKADIWSLGCTIIEMATGNPPYHELKNPITIMVKIGKSKQPPPIPDQLQSQHARDFLQKCLKINPKERATADELLQHPFIREQRRSSLLKKVSSESVSRKPILQNFQLDAEEVVIVPQEPISPQFQGQQGEAKTKQIKVKMKKQKPQYQIVIEPEQQDAVLTGQETNLVGKNKFQFNDLSEALENVVQDTYIKPFNNGNVKNNNNISLQNELDEILKQYVA